MRERLPLPTMLTPEADIADHGELAQWVKRWLAEAPDIRIWLLDGDLGAGKTTTVQAFCAALGVKAPVASPTYGLVHTYNSPHGPVHHIDLYRIKSMDEAFEAGLLDYIYGQDYCFVEWAERLPNLAPEAYIHLSLTVGANGHRHARLTSTYANA
jgi:tRNA threonylcarbamoyladenosine biosynthesis protein TsaE